MIIVTGGAGFIGSAFIWKLNEEGVDDILVVDELGESAKWKNLVNRHYVEYIHKDAFLRMIRNDQMPFTPRAIIHMGACSSTTERDADYLMDNNYHYTCRLAEWALPKNIRFVYASSAATYGDGSRGFSDDSSVTPTLRPMNMYGYSKQIFDLWVLRQQVENQVVGIKFFNVFGPNEYHKGDMRSVVHKAFEQISATGEVRLFRSHKPEYTDGGQMRDFVYVKDCVDVMWWLLEHPEVNGIFNLGTGKARTWNELAHALFSAMKMKPKIEYFDIPPEIGDQYQYLTEAKMDKLRATGCKVAFRPLEEAVQDYVVNYLQKPDWHL
ncbi:MAG TPA: ADP-glyceromanno-heptose 6-epimerase [Syntrophales bacterium]|nr:ADP-glyceromanno-heptose 6-epimerase [Syntrophales bacterium]